MDGLKNSHIMKDTKGETTYVPTLNENDEKYKQAKFVVYMFVI